MFEPSSLLPKQKKPYRAFLARRGETPFSRSNEDEEEAELLRTAPKNSFEILDRLKPRIAPKYNLFLFPVYNEFGKNAALVFHHLVVKIYGEHLQEMILSIRRETCIYIQVFHEEEHLRPKKGEAMITRIEIVKGKALEEYFLEMEEVMKAYAAKLSKWVQPAALQEPV
ncbi:MAG TPA: hypothetical protein VKV37_03505 [Ktedonobacteraceae bacterium]|nr:hypothetical protein [Ktedonobacteraceae bacterium]